MPDLHDEVNVPEQPTPNLFGVDETVDVTGFLTSLGVAVSKAHEDSKITFSDAFYFVKPLTTKLLPAISGISKVPDELMDILTDDEIKQIKDSVTEELPEGMEATEELITDSIDLAKQIKVYVFKHFVK